MNINKNNYEAFFIDYFDGNLSAELTAELFLFLESNPELKMEFDEFDSITLDADDEIFSLKNSLKREVVNDENFDWYMAAALEDDLNQNEKETLDAYLKANPHRLKDVQIFNKTKLEPGNEIYDNKNSLKQPIPFIINKTRTISYAIAAMLLLSIVGGSYYWFIKTNLSTTTEIAVLPAETNTPEVKQKDQQITQPTKNSFNGITKELSTGKPSAVNTYANSNQSSSTGIDNQNVTDSEPSRQTIVPVKTIHAKNIETPVLAALNPETKIDENLQVMEVLPETETVSEPNNNSQQYLSVWEAIRKGAKDNLSKISQSDDDALASLDGDQKNSIRLFNILGKGIEKVSNDKVNVDSNYDDEGKLSAFEFTAGKFKIERKKGF